MRCRSLTEGSTVAEISGIHLGGTATHPIEITCEPCCRPSPDPDALERILTN